MEVSNSREAFELNHAPRIGRTGFQSRLMPYLEDIIILVLSHYTAPQILEWLTNDKGVSIGRHAVGRFVKRIEIAVRNIEHPVTRADAVLAEAIRKVAASKATPFLPVKPQQLLLEAHENQQGRAVSAPKVLARVRVLETVTRTQVSPQEARGDRSSKSRKPTAEHAPSRKTSRLISSRAELDQKSAQVMRAAGKPQLMSSEELARMMQDIDDEASRKKE